MRPDLFGLFATALAALGLCWLPLATVVQLDNLRSSLEWVEIARLMARLLGLLALCALALALMGATVRLLMRGRVQQAEALAWLTVLLPTVSLCVGQFVYNMVLWARGLSGTHHFWSLPWVRWLLLCALALFFVIQWWRLGPQRVAEALAAPLLPLRWPAVALMLGCLALAWLPGRTELPRPAPSAQAPNILLLSIDTLAYADADPCGMGSGPVLMPHLQALARRSTCFTRAYSAGNLTSSATSTMATGLLPWSHHVYQGVAPLSASQRDLALPLRLRQAGYQNLAVTDTLSASPYQHGTWEAFDRVDLLLGRLSTALDTLSARFTRSAAVTAWWQMPQLLLAPIGVVLRGDGDVPRADVLVDRFLLTWDAMAANSRPVFAWMHSWAPHEPYVPPAQTRYSLLPERTLDHLAKLPRIGPQYQASEQPVVDKLRLRYRESLMGVDLQIGRLLQQLEQRGALDNLLLVLVADHGESFARGYLGHAGLNLDESVVHIPMVIKLPGQRLGQVVTQAVSQADLAPTLAAAAGLPAGAGRPLDGRSLLDLLQGRALPEQPVFSVAAPTGSRFRPLKAGRFAVFDGRWKYSFDTESNSGTLHDLMADPQESRDLAAQEQGVAQSMDQLLRRRLTDAQARRREEFGP